MKHIFALVRYFKRVILLLIGFQSKSNVAVLVLLSYKYIILYHVSLWVHPVILYINNTEMAFLLEMKWCISVADVFLC